MEVFSEGGRESVDPLDKTHFSLYFDDFRVSVKEKYFSRVFLVDPADMSHCHTLGTRSPTVAPLPPPCGPHGRSPEPQQDATSALLFSARLYDLVFHLSIFTRKHSRYPPWSEQNTSGTIKL